MKRILTVIVLAVCVVAWPRLEAQQPLFRTGAQAELAQARAIGLEQVRAIAARKGITGANDLVVVDAQVDRLSMAHARVQQYHRGVPVLGGQAIAHLSPTGDLLDETDALVAGVSVDTTAQVTREAAIGIATAHYGCSDCLTEAPTADLWIVRDDAGVDHLTYRVRMKRLDGTDATSMPVRFVDAHGGYVVMAYDNLQTGTGNSLYSGTVPVGTRRNTVYNDYVLENHSLRVGTFDMMNTTGSIYRFVDLDDVWNDSPQRAGVDAHYGMERFFGYLSTAFGRNGIDGSGGPFSIPGDQTNIPLVSSLVHYGFNYNNAFWDGQFMVYGDGDGSLFSPLVTVDIAGHEMMHGVTQFTADLIYLNESGALNESWSDVFGAVFERHLKGDGTNRWRIGEQAFTPSVSGDALRYMDAPHMAANGGYTADDDPDHYSERYTGSLDNGGVHINSGIPNKAFHLLAMGGSHHLGGSMTGIGPDDAARIWYHALAYYMTATTTFVGARTATSQAAAALFGAYGTHQRAVEQAWCLVGVGTCPPDLQAIAISPSSGTGISQPFTLTYSDSLGVTADLTAAQVRFVPAAGSPGLCVIHYRASLNQVRMQDDAGNWGPFTSFGAGTISNSYCSITLALASATPSGNNLSLLLPISFTPAFGGAKTVQMRATSVTGWTSGWVNRGTWLVGGVVQAVSVSPNSATGGTQSFTLTYNDSLGATDIKVAQVRFATANVAGGTCTIIYNAVTSLVRLEDDAGVNGPWTPFGSGTLTNSQCTLNLSSSSALAMGNDLLLTLNIRFSTTFTGAKNIYMRGNSNYTTTSGWVTRGTFTVGAIMDAISISPSSGTGVTRTFTLAFSDSIGAAADLKNAQVRFGPGASNIAAGICSIMFNAMTGMVRIADDAGVNGAWAPIGSATVLSNSQCSVDLAQSSASMFMMNLTLTLRVTFKAPLLGTNNVHMKATSDYGSTSGWETLGTWTVGATVAATSINPGSGQAAAATFTMAFSDSEGVVDDLKVARVRFAGATGPQCVIDYNAMTNMARVQDNSGAWGPSLPVGSVGVISNTQCSVNLGSSSAVRVGTDLTLTLSITFNSTNFAGAKTVSMRANSNVGSTTNWIARGMWTVP